MLNRITKRELFQAQVALVVAIALQLIVLNIGEVLIGAHLAIIIIEIALVLLIGFTSNNRYSSIRDIHHLGAIALLGLLSAANISSLVVVLNLLISRHAQLTGVQLLASALAIFATNIIVFALWYWEIDSPGLTKKRWSKNEKDFQFTQQDLRVEFPQWRPQFVDYLYLAVTNAINFAPADSRPLTRQAKLLMGSQALVSVFTLALVIARSVSILGT